MNIKNNPAGNTGSNPNGPFVICSDKLYTLYFMHIFQCPGISHPTQLYYKSVWGMQTKYQ